MTSDTDLVPVVRLTLKDWKKRLLRAQETPGPIRYSHVRFVIDEIERVLRNHP